jgi:hypothetical protein
MNSGASKLALATAILERAQKGEPSAMKIIEKLLTEVASSEEQEFPITDEQFQQIICLAADRIRGTA